LSRGLENVDEPFATAAALALNHKAKVQSLCAKIIFEQQFNGCTSRKDCLS
jgi:hypothetical protein